MIFPYIRPPTVRDFADRMDLRVWDLERRLRPDPDVTVINTVNNYYEEPPSS